MRRSRWRHATRDIDIHDDRDDEKVMFFVVAAASTTKCSS
jgi:hypothetical protein